MPDHRLTATRLTCFAIISAIEDDLRNFISTTMGNAAVTSYLPDDVRTTAQSRYQKDTTLVSMDSVNDNDLLAYIDFADLSKIITIHKSLFSEISDSIFQSIAVEILNAIGARNRVCHTRPLETDDFSILYDLANRCVLFDSSVFKTVRNNLDLLRSNPSFVFSLHVPLFWTEDSTSVTHNLPIPEFDETGFLGRKSDRDAIMKHLLGAYPVISITGGGGLGKTALAQRCAYDLLDNSDSCPYDAIIWISLKTKLLTVNGIEEIRDAISNSLDLWRALAMQLGTPSAMALNEDELLQEINQYLETFKMLLILDNCETLESGLIQK